jgi:HemY protein
LWLSAIQDDVPLKTARLMTTIELLVDDHQGELALAAVRELNASGTRHIYALRLALKANQRAGNWNEVLRLVRSLDNHNSLHPALSRRLTELAYEALLLDRNHDAESIRNLWQTIPAEQRVKPFVAIRAAETFNARGLQYEARAIVEKALAAEWDEKLVRAYRQSAAAEGSAALLTQIERCEAWSIERSTDAELALTLGTLCLKQKLWGKAQRHLEYALARSIDRGTTREAHLELAQLHEALNHAEQAAAHFRQCALV